MPRRPPAFLPRLPGVAALLALAGCGAPLAPADFAGTTPILRPDTFFAGTTRSTGVLENRAGAPTRRFAVQGEGQAEPDGSFRLDQHIAFEGQAPQDRTWLIRRLDAHRYAGTLSDASGPVEAQAYGNLFHLRYPMRSPALGHMEQWLYLQPDGRTVVNEATVRVLGLVVAHLSERITRDGPPVGGAGAE